MIDFVPQKDPKGCGIACLAMVTGQSYDEVRSHFKSIEKGMNDYALQQYLSDKGFATALSLGYHYPTDSKRDFKKWTKPFAYLHICNVKVSALGGGHYVVLTEDGEVLDPAMGRGRKLSDYEGVTTIYGIVPFKRFN